jgi:formylglycine-generating enzyme required for sulfatase activity
LPTEQQWEIAARGTDSKEYPWGTNFRTGDANVYLDSNQENLNQTCAVGLFPHRGSPYQVMDMAGNVWEWCLNEFDRPAQIEPNNSNAPRVMRGGCWDQKALDARTFVRRSRHPDLRDYDVGFRVVCQSPK